MKKKPPVPADLKAAIRDIALKNGFDAVGFAMASSHKKAREDLAAYIEAGYHGDMGWMAETEERRHSANALWPEAQTVIVLGMNYTPAEDPLKLLDHTERANISVYARNRDYHDLVKKKLKAVARWLHGVAQQEVKVFVDTAQVMEKPQAMRAGLGWQGKHSNLVSRQHGNWLFLGEIFTTAVLEPDTEEVDHCGRCQACISTCPTKAFPRPYQIDGRRCISYLTIENKGHIPLEFRKALGNRIYGCDDCLAVCPWNKFAKPATRIEFLPRAELTAPRLADFSELDDVGFRQIFSGSPVKRIGRDRFLRNVLLAMGNSQCPELIAKVHPHLSDPNPIIRVAAVWALRELLSPADFVAVRKAHCRQEEDPEVQEEWDRA